MELSLIFGSVSLLLIGIGTYIRKKEAIWLLANFPKEETKIRDKKGLANWAGMFLYLIAVLFSVTGFLLYKLIETKYSMLPVVIFIPVTSLLAVLFIAGGQRFLHKN